MIIEFQDIKKAKAIAIIIVIAAVLTYLVCSSKLFHYSEENPNKYLRQYNASSAAGKVLADSMIATGSVESSIGNSLSASRRKSSSGYDLFDEISNKHR